MKTPEKPNLFMLNRPTPRPAELQLTELSQELPDVQTPIAASGAAVGQTVQMAHVDDLAFGRYQTREITNGVEIEGLAASIASQGILQPILVRAIDAADPREESFEVIAGERRLRAARLAGLAHVPVLVKEFSDQDALEAAIIENAQRQDLNPVEEAQAYQRLGEEFRLTQKEIAEVVGKNRATIANSVRLLQLEPSVIEMLKTAQLSAGHGRALLALDDPRKQRRLGKRAAENGLSVHALEKLIQRMLENPVEDEAGEEDADRMRLDRQSRKIAETLGLEQVALNVDTQGRRRLNLVFDTEASWKRFMSRMRD